MAYGAIPRGPSPQPLGARAREWVREQRPVWALGAVVAALLVTALALTIALATRRSVRVHYADAPAADDGAAAPAFTLVRVGEILTPAPFPGNALLLSGGTILAMGTDAQLLPLVDCLRAIAPVAVVDEPSLTALPGFVDLHVHATGGGGEAGPESRTPRAQLSELVEAGVTSFVGTIGTDTTTHPPLELLVTARGLGAYGLSAYAWTGGYRFPPPTVTGDVRTDLLIREVLGVGELALSDHRGSSPTADELARLAGDVRVGGLLAGKLGVVYCHMGNGSAGLEPLLRLVRETPYPIDNVLPTHMARNALLRNQSAEWVALGGRLDFTASAAAVEAIAAHVLQGGVPADRLSVSSDAYGSLPVFDERGRLVSYTYARPAVLWEALAGLLNATVPLEDAVAMLTRNPARAARLPPGAGELLAGGPADLQLVDLAAAAQAPPAPRYVWASGRLLRSPAYAAKGMFEEALCPTKA